MSERRYRKRPVVITARQMPDAFAVETLEGVMRGKAGDWLITGVRGEQYPCDDEIFRQTYEVVGDESEGGGFDTAVREQAKTLANMAHEAGDAVAELQLRSIAKHGLTDARTLNPPTPTTGGSEALREVVSDE